MTGKTEKELPEDVDIINPGDCFGFYSSEDESCKQCEIADLCKESTEQDDV